MLFQWVKFTKFYRGGKHDEILALDIDDRNDSERLQQSLESWGETSDGGYENGYNAEGIDVKPTIEDITLEIENTENKLINCLGNIEYYKEKISKLICEKENLNSKKKNFNFKNYSTTIEKVLLSKISNLSKENFENSIKANSYIKFLEEFKDLKDKDIDTILKEENRLILYRLIGTVKFLTRRYFEKD